MTTGTLALSILVAILAQISVAAMIGIYRRRRQSRDLDGHGAESRTLVDAPASDMPTDGPSSPGEAWTGFREFAVQRREIEDQGRSICSFYLVPCDGKPLPTFRPGQFLTFRLAIEDPVKGESSNVVRCYSLSDAPRPDYYRVSIKRVPAPPDHPDAPPGVSSGFFHDHVQEGDHLMVKAPSGHFHLIEDEPLPIVLIGGGIGITPMLSILNSVLERGVGREIWLYYGVRNGSEHVMKGHLQALADKHDNFHLHVCYSAPGEDDVEGVDYDHRGRVDLPLLRNTLRLARYQFYVCGPKPMMESLVPELEQWGVDSGDIHYESFGPATLIKHEKPARIDWQHTAHHRHLQPIREKPHLGPGRRFTAGVCRGQRHRCGLGLPRRQLRFLSDGADGRRGRIQPAAGRRHRARTLPVVYCHTQLRSVLEA